jgi:hypothetical protein
MESFLKERGKIPERNAFIEKVYQDITGQKPDFKYSDKNGRKAVFCGINANYNVDVLASLVKTIGPEKIVTMRLDSKLPIDSGLDNYVPQVSLKTKMRFLDNSIGSVQREIEYAIESQKEAKSLLENKEQKIKKFAFASKDLGSDVNAPYWLGDFKLSFQPPKSKKPFLNINSSNFFLNGTGIQATIREIDNLPLLLRPLEYQIKNLESANKS